MRWTKRPGKRCPDPNEERVVTRFLLFPLELKDEVRWLETARIVQRYHGVRLTEYGEFVGGEWVNSHWEV